MRALVTTIAVFALPTSVAAIEFLEARRQMVEEIKAMAASVARETGVTQFSPEVISAIEAVPRHAFVPDEQRAAAYRNRPLPVGHGQTISQPFIVAMMTELLHVKPTDRILEVGTGSGYQAAILSELASEVYSIEIVRELGKRAAAAL